MKLTFRTALLLVLLAGMAHHVRGFATGSKPRAGHVGGGQRSWRRDGLVAGSTYESTSIFQSSTSGDSGSALRFPSYESVQLAIRKGLSWGIFGGIVAGFGGALHSAAAHSWLSISAGTWGAAAVALPLATVGACLFNLHFVYGNSEPGLIMVHMKGMENEDIKLTRALASIYDRAGVVKEGEINLELPRLFVVPSDEPNAFATGTIDNGAIAVTSGLLDVLTTKEVEAVLAHEVGHIQHKDTVIGAQIASMLGALGFVADVGGFIMDVTRHAEKDDAEDESSGVDLHAVGSIMYVSGTVIYCTGTLLRLFASRKDEYSADSFAKSIGVGPALVSALTKIDEAGKEGVKRAREDESALGAMNGAYAHAYINNPPGRDSPFIKLCGLLRTHPTISDRIQRLNEED